MTDGEMAAAGNSKERRGDYMFREDFYQAASSVDASIRRIYAAERKMAEIGLGYSEYPTSLFGLKLHVLELLRKFSRQVDPDTEKMICEMQSKVLNWTKEGRWALPEREIEKAETLGRVGRVKFCRGFVRQLLHPIKQMKFGLPGNISRPIIRSVHRMIDDMFAEERTLLVDVSSRGFKYGLFLGQFDDLWDDMRQLDSTESKLLAICMLSSESFVHCCSTVKFISTVISKLCDWVPELAVAVKSLKEDVPKVAEDEDDDEDGDVDDYEEEKKAEAYHYAAYRRGWESVYSKGSNFEDPTLFSSMHFTHYMPGHSGQTPMGARFLRTMQIYSINVTETEGFALEWPLEVYGIVAARDMVDYRRNVLFLRTRDDCQILTKENHFLHLTGPSRAIMSGDTVTIDADLKIKGTGRSKDRVLISKAFRSHGGNYGDCRDTLVLQGLCTMELEYEHIGQSVQATILSVCVVHGSLPCENGIVCYALLEDKTEGISLLDSQAGKMPIDEEGNLELSRQVISVKSKGRLNIFIKALSACGEISGSVAFIPKSSNVSQESCSLGGCEVEITVAWSLLVESQHVIELKGSAEPYEHELNPHTPRMKLEEDLVEDRLACSLGEN